MAPCSYFSLTLSLNPRPKPFRIRACSIPTPAPAVGPAAPSRGDVFLEREKSRSEAKAVLKEYKKQDEYIVRKKKRKEKKLLRAKIASAGACCYGCGAPLQTHELDAPGFVDPDTYELKKKHRQLKTVLCGRCKLLSHGHMITAVGGHGGYPGGKQFVSAEQLREKLSHLRLEKVLIIKLVDIVDFNGSFLSRVRDIAGPNPIILVITKVDLLPRDTDMNRVGDWVVDAVVKKKLNVLSVHLTSSKSLVGITGVISAIQNERKGRDVYILGSANVGKSAFISALLKTMGENDPAAAAAQKYKPVQSAVPGTTLGPIQIDAFLSGGKLYDTPGVHLHHRQAAVVHADDLPSLAPLNRLKPRFYHSDDGSAGLKGFSLFWGGLVRIDAIEVLPSTRLSFYGPKKIDISMCPISEADEFYKRECGIKLTPPTSKDKAETWLGLEGVRELKIKYNKKKGPVCDIAISGLGWISVEPFSSQNEEENQTEIKEIENINGEEEITGELQLKVYVAKPVEIFVRASLPVGKNAESWYQYQDLTDKEIESRPKWFY